MVKLCELCSRVNDHFSYDDVDNSEIEGEMMLELSTSSFRKEWLHIKEACSRVWPVKQNSELISFFAFAALSSMRGDYAFTADLDSSQPP